jgi:hypothetical protein
MTIDFVELSKLMDLCREKGVTFITLPNGTQIQLMPANPSLENGMEEQPVFDPFLIPNLPST